MKKRIVCLFLSILMLMNIFVWSFPTSASSVSEDITTGLIDYAGKLLKIAEKNGDPSSLTTAQQIKLVYDVFMASKDAYIGLGNAIGKALVTRKELMNDAVNWYNNYVSSALKLWTAIFELGQKHKGTMEAAPKNLFTSEPITALNNAADEINKLADNPLFWLSSEKNKMKALADSLETMADNAFSLEEVYYLGRYGELSHTHTYNNEVGLEKDHPHRGYKKCTKCGEAVYVSQSNYLASCTICNPPVSAPSGGNGSQTTPRTVDEQYVAQRLNALAQLLDGKYFTTTGKAHDTSGKHACDTCNVRAITGASWFKDMFGSVSAANFPRQYVCAPDARGDKQGTHWDFSGYTCFGFACFAQWYICTTSNTDNFVGSTYIATGKMTSDFLKKTVAVGDILRTVNDDSSPWNGHSMIVMAVDDKGITVLDCNLNLDCKVQKRTIEYGTGHAVASKTVVISRPVHYKPAKLAYQNITTPEKPIVSVSKNTWYDDEPITFSWQVCARADYYFPMVWDTDGNRVDVCWGTEKTTYSTNLAPGTYYLEVASVNASTNETVYSGKATTITVSASESKEPEPIVQETVETTVTFNANGGKCSFESKKVIVGEKYGILPMPTRYGYVFDGWYTEAGSKAESDTKVALNSDHILYAQWKEDESIILPSAFFPKVRDYMTFADVSESAWFLSSVSKAYEIGLMDGVSAKQFNPDGNITIAESITLAVRIYSMLNADGITFSKTTPWYAAYRDYALENGIISSDYADYDKPATRMEFAAIISNVLNDELLAQINDINSGDIPDVKNANGNNQCIYKLYRAGIISGSDTSGTFNAASNILRSEVSAIIARVADENLRIRFSLN